jgi:serine/threonine protein kinase
MCHERERQLQRDELWSITKGILLVVAALHARGWVHVDLKPENLMIVDGRLKLIDVDGCVRSGSSVCIAKTPISFSPYYCAPEWADLLVNCWEKAQDGSITVYPSLDVWSVGIILCELVTHEAIMAETYRQITVNAFSQRQAALLYMEWLSGISTLELPEQLAQADSEFRNFVSAHLLNRAPEQRQTLAECLHHPDVAGASHMLWQNIPFLIPDKPYTPEGDVAAHGSRGSIRLDAAELEAMKRFSVARQSGVFDAPPPRESSSLPDGV